MSPDAHMVRLPFRWIVTALLLMMAAASSFGQIDSVSNRSEQRLNLSEFVENIFLYPNFTSGKIGLKDGTVVSAKLNYDRVLGQLLFLGRGKTLAFADPEALDYVAIGRDTFRYFEHKYLRLLTHFPKVNLYTMQKLTYYVKSEAGIIGTSVVITTSSNPAYKSESLSKPPDELSQNSIFVFSNELYVRSQPGIYYEASRRNIFNLYPDKAADLRKYLLSHLTRFGNTSEMEGLVEFLNTL